ncbi:MAG: helix-turn-helix domain-containing protein [Planctomycetia bacterium]|nr:helix-turn-helix domain-containing protein [Planctomycetia bacterium]
MTNLERVRARRFSVQEAAEFVGVQKQTIYRWHRLGINSHRLTLFKVGCRTYVSEQDLENFMALTSGMKDDTHGPATIVRAESQMEKAAKLADGKLAAAGY